MTENTLETIRLMVVSKEPAVVRPLWTLGEYNSWQVETAASGWEAMERVQSGVAPHVLVLDLPRGDGDSLHILRWMRRLRPDLPVVVLCYPEDAARKNEATRLGASDVLVRPFDERQLEFVIQRHLDSPADNSVEMASENVDQISSDEFFVSASAVMQKLRAQAELLAQADVPVLILGERGTGKETVARLIHKLSVRSGFKFLKVNCEAMPGELLEMELFGNARASFPGNARLSQGKLEIGEKGTIFLEEITAMPAALQMKLVQLLQANESHKLAGERGASEVRILAATSTNLERALAERKLREDLYYRLSAFTVHVPPLRQRKEEISILLRYQMHRLAKYYGMTARELSAATIEACQHYNWPGNLRELENFVKRFLVAGEQEPIPGEAAASEVRDASGRDPVAHNARPLGAAWSEVPRSLKSLVQSIKSEAERNAIGAALEKTGWNRKAAARMLKVSYRTLLYKIEQYHMSAAETTFPAISIDLPVAGDGVKGNGKLG